MHAVGQFLVVRRKEGAVYRGAKPRQPRFPDALGQAAPFPSEKPKSMSQSQEGVESASSAAPLRHHHNADSRAAPKMTAIGEASTAPRG